MVAMVMPRRTSAGAVTRGHLAVVRQRQVALRLALDMAVGARAIKPNRLAPRRAYNAHVDVWVGAEERHDHSGHVE